jgi:outer membrane lipoprotein-sorting protein
MSSVEAALAWGAQSILIWRRYASVRVISSSSAILGIVPSKGGVVEMKFLRTASTGRVLAVIVGLVVAIAAGTAIAVAAAGSGPVPQRESLATAVHGAATARAVKGISANITFTNNLIGASDFQGGPTDPLLQGATGRLWLSNDHRFRLELQSDNGDAQVVVNKDSFWISDPAQNVVYKGTLPASRAHPKRGAAQHAIPTIAQIQSDINRLAKRVSLSGAIPGDIAGQPAYTVRVSPKHDGGLLGSLQLGWDAVRGVPLRFAIYARDNSTPVLELKATDISYGSVSASVFNIAPPAGSKVVKIATSQHQPAAAAKLRSRLAGKRAHARVHGVAAVAARLPFKLVAPKTLVGLPRHGALLLNMGGDPAALVTYGKGLGGIAVIEHAQSGSQGSQGAGLGSLSLPAVSINGTTGHELDTPLGTVITFARDGVGYTVLGSVPSAAADMAAQAL